MRKMPTIHQRQKGDAKSNHHNARSSYAILASHICDFHGKYARMSSEVCA